MRCNTCQTNRTYQIGDVADMIGMSRDTLRHYEKRGLISPKKGENGYRYYTDDDVQRLLGIMYQRKMNLGLSDIESIWSGRSTLYGLDKRIDQRIEEEQQAIRAHQQTIARLKLSRADALRFTDGIGTIQIQEYPDPYVIVPQTTLEESISQYFQYARQYPGLDMMYIYDEYQWQHRDGQIFIDYKNSQLVLSRDLKELVDYPVSDDTQSAPSSRFCVSTFCVSPTRIPSPETVQAMSRWASNQELIVSQQLFVTFLSQGMEHDQKVWYLQLLMPVF